MLTASSQSWPIHFFENWSAWWGQSTSVLLYSWKLIRVTRQWCPLSPSRFHGVTRTDPLQQKITGLLPCSQSVMWLRSSLLLFLLSCERKTAKTFVQKAKKKKNIKNVLLNALCLLTSLSCQFFCSAFVVAKDLCASSFVSNLRCQRCPFDVERTPPIRYHLCCRSYGFRVLLFMWLAARGCSCVRVSMWMNSCT